MDLSNININFTSKIKPIKSLNENFTLCRCYVLALGKNRNRSNITKEVVDNALPSIFNIPVVGNLYESEDGNEDVHMGGHDVALEKGSDGKYKFKVLTVPYGVVPEDSNLAYEEIEEADGTINTYLSADIILWTGRNPKLLESVYDENIFWGQSMEISPVSVSRNKDNKEITDINEFVFSALCLLGKSDDEKFHVEPCFPSAAVKPKTSEDYDFSQHFQQMKEELAICFSNQNSKKEENQVEENKKTQSQLEELAEKANLKNDSNKTEDFEKNTEKHTQTESTNKKEDKSFKNFALTYNEKIDAINNELSKLEVSSENGFVFYRLCDFDDVFTYVEEVKFDQNGYNCVKGRFAYKFNENVAQVDAKTFELMFVKWLTKSEVDEVDKMREDLKELTAYKANNETAVKKQKLEAVLEEFSDLKDDSAFKTLTDNIESFESEEDLKEKLFAIRGKKMAFTFKKESKQKIKIPVELDNEKDNIDPYGAFIEKYLKK